MGQRKIVIKFFPYIPPQLLDINNPKKTAPDRMQKR